MFKVVEYYEDLKYWSKNGYAADISHQMACPLIKNLVEVFR